MNLRLAEDLTLPRDAVTQTFGLLAKRGVGKTYTASVLVEEMLKAGLPVVVVDPIGVWWGLRASADGTGPGLSIAILGGDHGDVPLEETAGAVVADLIVDERISAVLDLSLFRKAQQTRFMTDFAERLYHRNREPLHLVLDEADAFAPQRPMKGQERLLGAIEDLVRRGRARGLGITLVTQRAAVINKDVLTQVEVLVALRTIAPQDRDAIDAWIRVHGTPEQREELMSSLPSLPIGTAWFWSPGWLDLFQRVQVRRRETFDSSATPKLGESVRPPKALADVDLEVLRERMAATIERSKADDPKALRRRIAELEKALQERPAETPAEVRIERVDVISDGSRMHLTLLVHELADRLTAIHAEIDEAVAPLVQELEGITERLADLTPNVARAGGRVVQTPARPASPPISIERRRESATRPAETASDVKLRAGERKMLATLARYPQALTRQQLATLSGYAVTGGTFSTYFGTLKRAGFLEEADRTVCITAEGYDYLGNNYPAPPLMTGELLDLWKGSLRAGERSMLDELVAIYPDAISRDDLGDRTGYTTSGGTFGTYLGTLRRNGLIEVDGAAVRASDTLFLGGQL